MAVDISTVLHVLAHELRTSVGIAHGYIRLLLEDRLPEGADRRRALDQMQKALGRVSELSQESTALAAWCECESTENQSVEARALLDWIEKGDYANPIVVDTSGVATEARVRTSNADALRDALVTVVRATARELRGQDCAVSARTGDDKQFELLAGPSGQLATLGGGPDAEGAGAIALDRGGLGLALVHADAVLDRHGAKRWTMNGSRQIVGIRLPLEERPLP